MSSRGADTVIIDAELRASLRAELRRTGITAIRLLAGPGDQPDGLDARAVNRWMSGLLRAAPLSHVEYVQARWGALPDAIGRVTADGRKLSKRGARHPTQGETWIEVTDDMAHHLREELTRTGLKSAAILRGLTDLPPGLNQRIVYGWLHGEAKTTNAAHWAFVVTHLIAQPDKSS